MGHVWWGGYYNKLYTFVSFIDLSTVTYFDTGSFQTTRIFQTVCFTKAKNDLELPSFPEFVFCEAGTGCQPLKCMVRIMWLL